MSPSWGWHLRIPEPPVPGSDHLAPGPLCLACSRAQGRDSWAEDWLSLLGMGFKSSSKELLTGLGQVGGCL